MVPKVLSHKVLLTGLSSGQTYYYRVVSAGSPTAIGQEKTFKTLSETGAPPPAESNIILGTTTVFPFYKSIFVSGQSLQAEKSIIREKPKTEVLGKSTPPAKSFFARNLGWFVSLSSSSTGLFLLQLRKLRRLRTNKRKKKARK